MMKNNSFYRFIERQSLGSKSKVLCCKKQAELVKYWMNMGLFISEMFHSGK
jgi:hypothetical protein